MIKGAANFAASSRQFIKTYYPCDELEFAWEFEDVKRFDAMWNDGESVWSIAEKLGRDPDEVAILVIDRKRKGKIAIRSGGVFGNGTGGNQRENYDSEANASFAAIASSKGSENQ